MPLPDHPDEEFTQSYLGVPILVGDEVMGVVDVQSYERHAYDEGHLRLLSTITASMGVALENARLFEETNRLLAETEQRNAELAVINSVQQALAAELDIQAIYDAVGDQIRDTFDAQVVDLNSFEHDAELWHTNYLIEKGQRFYPEPEPLNNLHRHLIRTRQLVLINEFTDQAITEFGLQVTPGTEMPKSALYVPLVVGDLVRGYVSLQNVDRENAFSPSDVRLLSTLAASLSVALENARLFEETTRLLEETQQRTAELQIINSVQQGLASKLDFQAIIDLVGDKIGETLASDSTAIYLYDRSTDLIHNPYSVERGQRLHSDPFPLGRGLTSKVIESRQPLVFGTQETAYELGAAWIAHPDHPDEQFVQSYLGVPILAGDEVMGVVDVQSYEQHAFDESHMRLLSTITASMGVALENARLFEETTRLLEETQQQTSELQIINSIQQGLASKLDFQAIIDLVGDKMREIFGGQMTFVALYDRATNRLDIPYWMDGQGLPVQARSMELGEGLTSIVIQSRQPLVLGTVLEQQEHGGVFLGAGPHEESWLGVPIVVGREVTGTITLQDWPQNRYDEGDVRLLSTLAASMGVALENARLFEETNRLLAESEQRASELAIINDVGQALAGQLDQQGIVDLVGDKAAELFKADASGVALYDRETNLLHYLYWQEAGQRLPEQAPYALGPGLTSQVIEARQPLVLGTHEAQMQQGAIAIPLDPDDPDEQKTESWLGVPILSGGQVTGVINVQSYRQNTFEEADAPLAGHHRRQRRRGPAERPPLCRDDAPAGGEPTAGRRAGHRQPYRPGPGLRAGAGGPDPTGRRTGAPDLRGRHRLRGPARPASRGDPLPLSLWRRTPAPRAGGGADLPDHSGGRAPSDQRGA